MVLEGLHHVEVGSFAFREAILAVELQLGSDNGVLTPAMHVKGGLGKHEGAGIGHIRSRGTNIRFERNIIIGGGGSGSPLGSSTKSTVLIRSGHLEESRRGDEVARGGLGLSTESVDGVGESIDGVGVVVRLGTQGLEEHLGVIKGRAVVNVGIRLNNPDEFLARVVEVQLDLVGRGSNRLVTSELHLLDEVLVGVLCHLAALIRVEENIVNIEGSGHQGLLVRDRGRDSAGGSNGIETLHGPETLADGADIKVDLHFVVLYEPLVPPLSGYLLAFSYSINFVTYENFCQGLDYILSHH